MASAAAVAAAIPAVTFNAAGLHKTTLYQRDAAGDLMVDANGNYLEIYAGSVGRYENAGGLIDARYVDWDLLSLVQDDTPLYDALGRRTLMDGPYDFEIGAAAVQFAASFAAGQAWSAAYAATSGVYWMVESHLGPAYLFGLLVTSSEDLLGYGLQNP